MLNLDTHILVFLLDGTLRADEARRIGSLNCGMSAVVLWEMYKLHQIGRIDIAPDSPLLRAVLRTIEIWPVTREVCEALATLDFKSDPADELIAATSIAHQAPLLTRDRKLLASNVVPLAR